MGQAIFWGAIALMALVAIFLSGKNKGGFVRHFSRGAFMRELNAKAGRVGGADLIPVK